MINFIYLMMIILLMTMMLMSLNFMLSKVTLSDREKSSPFECGFDPLSNNHAPFSIQFFIISLIFLIFDIEITLLVPLIFMTPTFNLSMIMCSFSFLIILIYGLYMEYLENSIDWKL